MTKIKLCGLSRLEDIETVNGLKPEFIGFVFYKKSIRYVDFDKAAELKKKLDPEIKAVGVFIDEDIKDVAYLLNEDIIDIAQLHGREDEEYISELRKLTGGKPVIKAFRIKSVEDASLVNASSADYVLLDSGAGDGKLLDRSLLREVKRDYFLAGGLDPENVKDALKETDPFAVDVSSGIETDKKKDPEKMKKFVKTVRDMR